MGMPNVFWMVWIRASGPLAKAELILFSLDSPLPAAMSDRVT